MLKKVFRIWKMLESDLYGNLSRKDLEDSIQLSIISLKVGWPFKIEGLTKEEIKKRYPLYTISENWFVEEE